MLLGNSGTIDRQSIGRTLKVRGAEREGEARLRSVPLDRNVRGGGHE